MLRSSLSLCRILRVGWSSSDMWSWNRKSGLKHNRRLSVDIGTEAEVTVGLHASVASLVDNDAFPALVHVMVQTKEGTHTVHQHPVVGRHLRELQVWVSAMESTSVCSRDHLDVLSDLMWK